MNPHDRSAFTRVAEAQIIELPRVTMEENEFNLEHELDEISKAVAAAEPEPEVEEVPQVSPEQMLEQQILHMLRSRQDAPTVEQIGAWKAKFGEHAVNVTALDPDNVFVYTFLTVAQWDKIGKLNEALQQKKDENAEKRMKEAIVRTAILWPKLGPDFFQTCRAGLPNTLFDAIMVTSYFLTPQQTLTLTTKL